MPRIRTLPSLYSLLLYLTLGMLSVSLLYISLFRHFSHDEFEHIHSAWYITQQALPHRDFFQHHNPLFWYALTPLFLFLKESSQILTAGRILVFLGTLAMAYLTFLITRMLTKSYSAGLIAAILLLANTLLTDRSLQIRPDVPQVLFGLASIYFLVGYLARQKTEALVFSSIAASLSLLFLQKSSYFVFLYGLVLLFLWLRGKIHFRLLLTSAAAFLIPPLLFVAHLLVFDMLEDYVLTGWMLNMTPAADSFSALRVLEEKRGSLVFFGSAVLSGAGLLVLRRVSLGARIVAFFALGMLFSAFTVRYPYLQYFMFAIPLLTVCLVTFVDFLAPKLKWSFNPISYLALVLFLVFLYRSYLYLGLSYANTLSFLALALALLLLDRSRKALYNHLALASLLALASYFSFLETTPVLTNFLQKQTIDFVVENSSPGDRLHDPNINYNLFRPDLHYFWYSVDTHQSLFYYNRLTDNKYGDYDSCALVRESMPKFTSDAGWDLKACGLEEDYQEIIGRDELAPETFYQYAIYIRGPLLELNGTGAEALGENVDALQISHPVNARFGDSLLLLGYDLEPEVIQEGEGPSERERQLNGHVDWIFEHGTRFQVTYYWQALESPSSDYEIRSEFVADYEDEYLVDQSHQPVNGAYPTSTWQPGEIVREAYWAWLPAGYPPLRYALRISVVDAETGEPLPVTDVGEASSADDVQRVVLGYLELEPVHFPVASSDPPQVPETLQHDLGNGLVLQGYDLKTGGSEERSVRAGQSLEMTTSWLVDGPVAEDYPAWVELADGASRVRALLGLEPTRLWEPGHYYLRRGELALSPYLLPGQYDLSVVVGDNPEQRVALGAVEVGWARNPRRVIDHMGVADGEKGDVRPLDTDQPLRLNFSLDRPMELKVVTGWIGEALVEETRVEVYLHNGHRERYLTTWEVPRGEQSVTSVYVPKKLTSRGRNSIILRVPEERGKPHYVGWRAWVDAVFPDVLYDLSGPHDGWIWPDFVQVSSDWREEWGAYRDLARRYTDLEMYAEAADLFDEGVGKGLRPERVEDIDVFAKAVDALDDRGEQVRVREMVESLIANRVDVNLGDKVEVLGYSLEQVNETEGRLHLFFRSVGPTDEDYTVWLHQYDEGGEGFTSLDRRLQTSRWEPGRVYQETWEVELPGETVKFTFGMWRWEDGSRLWLKDAPDQHEVDLGWIKPSRVREE